MEATSAAILFFAVVLVAVLVMRKRPAARNSDTAIITSINAAFARAFQLSNISIDVKAFDGVVILGGFAHEFAQVKQAVDIASATPGVKSVDNRISIRSGS